MTKKTFLLNVGFALCYFFIARLGLYLATINESASPVWPATGFAFTVVYFHGRRAWAAIFAGAFLANLSTGGPIAAAFFISIGNTLEAIVGVCILQRVFKFQDALSFQTETLAIALASGLGSLVSATIGVTSLYATGAVPADLLMQVWATWWVGDALGGLVITPLLLKHREFRWPKFNIHFAGIALASITAFYIVFLVTKGHPFLFLLFPILLYAKKTYGKIGVLFVSFLICIACVTATVSGVGPFSLGNLNERLVHLQLFLASIALTSMMLAAYGPHRLTRLPMTVLTVCWFLSGLLFYSFEQSEHTKTQQSFESLVASAQDSVEATLGSYENVMKSASGLFAASEEVSLQEWRQFLSTVEVEKSFPGMTGIGVVVPVDKKDVAQFEKKEIRQGLPGYRIKPIQDHQLSDNKTNHRLVVKFIEPIERNSEALGYDIATESVRRETAELARDTGLPTITPVVQIAQGSSSLPGFHLYLPLYKIGYPTKTVEQRQKALQGWIFSRFITQTFANSIPKLASGELALKAYVGNEMTDANLAFSNVVPEKHSTTYKRVNQLKLGNREFTFVWASGSAFVSSHNTIVAWVSFCGALLSLMLTTLMISLQTIGERSRELAEKLTKELSESREKFKEGERRLLYALDGSNDGIWDWNIANSEMYVSGGICEEYGWPQTFKIASIDDMRKWTHPDDLKRIRDSIQLHLADKSPSHEVETRYRTKNGEYKWVLTRGKISEYDLKGNATRMTGVHIDIHALKMAESALVNSQYQLRNIANTVPTLISLWNRDMLCEFSNDSFADWFGLTQSELIHKRLQDLISSDHFERTKDYFNRALNGETINYEREVPRISDNSKRFVRATYLPNRLNGQPDGFFLFIQDITDLKEAELKAVNQQRLAVEATNIKSQFLANMSHEIRTPINGIIGITNLLKSTILSEQQAEYAEIIDRSSKSLLAIINDILDFSKIEAGKLSLEKIDFDLEVVMSDAHKSLLFAAKNKHIDLDLQMNLGGKRFFNGDPGRLTQVFNNLIGNGIKFTNDGRVTLRGTQELEENGISYFLFEVIDTGIGIDDQALGKMFQPFSQADTTTTRKFGGTGLGLSISKQIVELMGGEIGVTSYLGKGSNFWFKIPLVHGEAPVENVTERLIQTAYPNARILLAEDNKVNQMIAMETLRGLGYTAFPVNNGKEAIEELGRNHYDLILMDCQMPEMDGYQATAVIRSAKNAIPIIAMTANAFKGDREKCMAAGMNDYVSKPVNRNLLFKAVEQWLTKDEPIESVKPDVIARLKSMQKPGGPDIFARLVNLYFESAADDMNKIRQAFSNRDYAAMSSAAHSLKSSSANLGAVLVSEVCAHIEKLGSSQTQDEVQTELLLTKLESEYAKAIEKLKSFEGAA